MNINNTLEVVTLGAALGKAFNSANSDGTVNAADLGELIAVVPHISPAVDGISQVPAELKDLDPKEAQILVDKVSEIAGVVGSEKAQRLTEKSLKLGLAGLELIQEFRSEDAA